MGMILNIPVAQMLEVVREELKSDEILSGRTKWKMDDIIKLLECPLKLTSRR